MKIKVLGDLILNYNGFYLILDVFFKKYVGNHVYNP